nr:EOG090X05NC [Leptodora kindtii]
MDHLDAEKRSERSETVDLNDGALQVDISDALSEREKVKFTVHTKTNLPEFAKADFSVVRQHEEFIWLHDRFEEDESYAGYIIPPPPPRPDFDSSREKLQKLGEGEGSLTGEEFKKMKQELEAEYLATFKKTVAMHEVFLCRLANHPVFRNDHNFRVFLEYEQDLSVRGKNKKEKLETLLRTFSKTTDEILLSSTQKDVDEFFDKEKNFLLDYHSLLRDASVKADRMTKCRKDVADSYIKISSCLLEMATVDANQLERFATKTADIFEKARKIESRVSTDQDLKLSDTLRYYMRDTTAAKNLLFRRLRCLANYETANRALEKARAKNKDVHAAEWSQHQACEKFEQMSAKAKEELMDFKTRRVSAFKKNLIELSELELKHANPTLVREVAAPDVGRMGIEILSFTIKDVYDDVTYLSSLGKTQAANVKRDATVGVAQANRDAGIREAECEKAALDVKYKMDAKVADNTRLYHLQKANYDREMQTAKAEAAMAHGLQTAKTKQQLCAEQLQVTIIERRKQIEIEEQEIMRKEKELTATVKLPAEAESYQVEIIAHGRKAQVVEKARGEAEKTKLIGMAEASCIENIGRANAEAMRLKAAVSNSTETLLSLNAFLTLCQRYLGKLPHR